MSRSGHLVALQQETSADRSTEFVPVEGGADATSAATLMVVAYLLMWALLLGFVLMTWRRQRQIEAKVGELEQLVAQRGPGPPSG